MGKTKKIDKRESLTVVTDNKIIDAQDISKLSLNARKLFYVAVSQCKKNDEDFYEYETTPAELSEMWGVSRQEIYQTARNTCKELMSIVITLPYEGKKGFKMRHIFEKCDYDENSKVVFKLHTEMADLLLGLKKNFTKPLLWDFMKMRSPYSMALWHLFQREMKSFKPMMEAPIEFDLTLEELRKVTGCENKLKQISEFKKRVLDKALVEIKRNCLTDISYVNIKQGRTVTGFRFTAKSVLGTMDVENLSYRMRQWMRKAVLVHKLGEGTITASERAELEEIRQELMQSTIEDIENGYPME